MTPFRRLIFAVVCLLWAGVLLGVALAEAVKFHAPSLSRSAAFDVGRTVFRASQTAQLLPLGLAVVAAASSRIARSAWACLLVAGLALLIQTLWLFPLLDARAQTLIAGGVLTGPSPHASYAFFEVLKVLALTLAAVLALRTPNQGQ